MSLQWTAVATFLYVEVFLVLLLCIPFISPKRSVFTFNTDIVRWFAQILIITLFIQAKLVLSN
uniref:BAP29/BAP31 transmembrane domain-containing protein n=1 Tax=Cyprinodon variegatus TaxID=28743 RepID=A0A3Q2D5E8_CYPVA